MGAVFLEDGRAAPCFYVVGNGVSYDTKASGGRRTPRRGIWLLTQPRSGASVRQAHTFLLNRKFRPSQP